MRRATLPKVLPPRLGRVVRRARVAQALIGASERGAAWVQAPGGWGKTTAVAALAGDLKRPVAWLHLDSGDSELRPFFHFLRLAIVRALPRSERELPVFADAFAAEAVLFMRRFARAALECASAEGATIVLDNLHDLPEDSAAHAVAAALVEELGATWRVFLVTRAAPGRAYQRLLGQGKLVVLDPGALAFSHAELGEALREHGIVDERRVKALARTSGGWIAGALLMAMHGGEPGEQGASGDPGIVFDYFATQALAGRADADRRLLVRTAFLETIDPDSAARLSGLDDAGKRLERLARDGVFTTRVGTPARYRYHDLFRDYLRAEARSTLASGELAALEKASAEELLAMGDSLHALELLAECGAWDAFAGSALRAARELIGRGQYRRLAELLLLIPSAQMDADPWLRYWLGQCELQQSEERACAALGMAHDAFERKGDRAGQLVTAIEMPQAFFSQFIGNVQVQRWTRRVEELADARGELRDSDLRVKVLTGLVGLYQSPVLEAGVEAAVEELMAALPHVDDPSLRLKAFARIVSIAWRTGRPALAPAAIAMVDVQELERRVSPLLVLHWYYEIITYDSIYGDPARAAANGLKAEAIATEIALPQAMFEAMILREEVACDSNELPLALGLLARIEALVDPRRPTILVSATLFRARISLLEGDGDRALAAARRGHELVRSLGNPDVLNPAAVQVEVTALALQGRYAEALEACADYEPRLRRFDRVALDTTSRWIRAAKAIADGDPQARALLEDAVGTAVARQDFHPLRHASVLAAPLCARALEWGIAPDFVRRIISRRRLPAPDPTSIEWPWKLRVRCLGGFEVRDESGPIADRARSQKSLELLQLVIALGGDQVPVDRIVKTLWPGERREGAQQAFDTTLHRLRKLLGSDAALRVADRRLTIDRELVWVDALALDDAIGALERARSVGTVEDWRRLVALYAGHFLPHRAGDAWADEARARLWGRTRRFLIAAARASHAASDDPQAERLLYFIADLDPLAEDAMAELMRLHIQRGQAAEALRVFRRCQAALAAELRVEPGAELQALAKRAREAKVSQL